MAVCRNFTTHPFFHLGEDRSHRLRRAWLLGAGLLTLLNACSATLYKPTLHLEDVRESLAVIVFQEPLRDLSPPDDHVPMSDHRVVITAPNRVEGELPILVARAIRSDFSATSVFSYFASVREQADLILTGTIYRFVGEVALPLWSLVPGLKAFVAQFFRATEQWQGEVNLELTLSTRDGRLVGVYHGQSRYQETASAGADAWSVPLYPAHARLNQAFTEVLVQIRTQLFQDRELILRHANASRRPAPSAP